MPTECEFILGYTYAQVIPTPECPKLAHVASAGHAPRLFVWLHSRQLSTTGVSLFFPACLSSKLSTFPAVDVHHSTAASITEDVSESSKRTVHHDRLVSASRSSSHHLHPDEQRALCAIHSLTFSTTPTLYPRMTSRSPKTCL